MLFALVDDIVIYSKGFFSTGLTANVYSEESRRSDFGMVFPIFFNEWTTIIDYLGSGKLSPMPPDGREDDSVDYACFIFDGSDFIGIEYAKDRVSSFKIKPGKGGVFVSGKLKEPCVMLRALLNEITATVPPKTEEFYKEVVRAVSIVENRSYLDNMIVVKPLHQLNEEMKEWKIKPVVCKPIEETISKRKLLEAINNAADKK